ncbi:hypothetical protein MKW92_033984, partial [Papaver armeniacum]
MESTSLSDETVCRRVFSHSQSAILTGVREWKFNLAWKLYEPGIMLWQDADRASRNNWPHLRRNKQWTMQ